MFWQSMIYIVAARSCLDIIRAWPSAPSGQYGIKISCGGNAAIINGYCDMTTDGMLILYYYQ